jgi:hypothetical protein
MRYDTKACIALAIAIAVAPVAIDGRGVTSNDSFAVNASTTLGSTNYFTLQPGASKHFYNGVEVRICNDEGPMLTALVDPDGTRPLWEGECMLVIGHAVTIRNDANRPARFHLTIQQRTHGN